eukprot:9255373-Prorocentrum_lima.AAC.1
MIGSHVFCPETTTENVTTETWDNRTRLIALCAHLDLLITNTFFDKRPEHLVTYLDNKRHGGGPPYTRRHYDTLDYILTPRR